MPHKPKSKRKPWVPEKPNKFNTKKTDKFYWSQAWRKLRKKKIEMNPFCEECKTLGYITAAKEVDHIYPRQQYPDYELDMNNLRSLCKSHHAKKRAYENNHSK